MPKLTKDEVVERLKPICEKGLTTNEGNVPFLLTVDEGQMRQGVKRRIGVHGEQFYLKHVQKFIHLLNRCDCEWWIYASDVKPGWVMLVVDFF